MDYDGVLCLCCVAFAMDSEFGSNVIAVVGVGGGEVSAVLIMTRRRQDARVLGAVRSMVLFLCLPRRKVEVGSAAAPYDCARANTIILLL